MAYVRALAVVSRWRAAALGRRVRGLTRPSWAGAAVGRLLLIEAELADAQAEAAECLAVGGAAAAEVLDALRREAAELHEQVRPAARAPWGDAHAAAEDADRECAVLTRHTITAPSPRRLAPPARAGSGNLLASKIAREVIRSRTPFTSTTRGCTFGEEPGRSGSDVRPDPRGRVVGRPPLPGSAEVARQELERLRDARFLLSDLDAAHSEHRLMAVACLAFLAWPSHCLVGGPGPAVAVGQAPRSPRPRSGPQPKPVRSSSGSAGPLVRTRRPAYGEPRSGPMGSPAPPSRRRCCASVPTTRRHRARVRARRAGRARRISDGLWEV
jgi:hypothetical protein